VACLGFLNWIEDLLENGNICVRNRDDWLGLENGATFVRTRWGVDN
jgi:hypothetical protein